MSSSRFLGGFQRRVGWPESTFPRLVSDIEDICERNEVEACRGPLKVRCWRAKEAVDGAAPPTQGSGQKVSTWAHRIALSWPIPSCDTCAIEVLMAGYTRNTLFRFVIRTPESGTALHDQPLVLNNGSSVLRLSVTHEIAV